MTEWFPRYLAYWTVGAAVALAAASPAAATCAQVHNLLAQGLSVAEVSAALNAPPSAVQACVQPRSVVVPAGRGTSAVGPPPFGAAGPAPFGAAGPAPIGAAGPAPIGAAGPAPLGAAGPAPFGAAGPAPIGSGAKPLNAAR